MLKNHDFLNFSILNNISETEFKRLNQLVVSTWDYQSWVSQDKIEPMAEFFLDEIILASSCIFVAKDKNKDKIVGVISVALLDNMQTISKTKIRKYQAIQKLTGLDQDNVFYAYLETLILNERLLLRSEKTFQAELKFFMIDQDYRGLGIGNQLFTCFKNYLIEKNISKFFLWTDNSSNYHFYENKGLVRLEEEEFPWNEALKEQYYLYEGSVD